MLKRELQTIKLKLSDINDYEATRPERRRNKTKTVPPPTPVVVEVKPSTSNMAVFYFTGADPAPTEAEPEPDADADTATASSATTTSSTTPVTQEDLQEHLARAASTTGATTTSGSTDDDTSVVAVVDDNDTVEELSDADHWVDIEDEEGTETTTKAQKLHKITQESGMVQPRRFHSFKYDTIVRIEDYVKLNQLKLYSLPAAAEEELVLST